MKSFATIVFLFISLTIHAQSTSHNQSTNQGLAKAPTVMPEGFRAWRLLNGVKFTAKPIDFNGTNTVTFYYMNGQRGTLAITNLAKEDAKSLIELRPDVMDAKDKRLLATKKKELENDGYVEFTVSQLKNFPEKIRDKKVYAVATFGKIESFEIEHDFNRSSKELSRISGDKPDDSRTNFLGFTIIDSEGERFDYCCGLKERDASILLNLKHHQKIIVIGVMGNVTGRHDWLYLNSLVTLP